VTQWVRSPNLEQLVEGVQGQVRCVHSVNLVAVHLDNAVAAAAEPCPVFEIAARYFQVELTLTCVDIALRELELVDAGATENNRLLSDI